MASLVRDLIGAGIHFGQRRSNWNPKMKPYLFGVRHRIHIIDIRQTLRGLLLGKKYVQRIVSEGKDVCFVGTKRQARAAVEKYAIEVGMPYVVERWLGGTLTNQRTIRERLKRLEELEQLVESGEIANYSKKMASQLLRQKRKITRNLQGVRNMSTLPGALVVIDVAREINALREARGLGIPTIALVDSDGDPDLVDIPIPGNDDSMRSIDVVMRELCDAVRLGKMAQPSAEDRGQIPENGDETPRRRSSRAMFRAADEPAPATEDGPSVGGPDPAAGSGEPAPTAPVTSAGESKPE